MPLVESPLRLGMKLLGVMLALLVLPLWCRGELVLVAETEQGLVKVERLGAGRLLGAGPTGSVALSLEGKFRIEGDLGRHAGMACWSPYHLLMHPPARDGIEASRRPSFGYVRLVSGSGWNGLHAEEIWAQLPDPALAVFAWVLAGRVAQVKVAPLPSKSWREHFRLDAMFQLSDAEAAGQPVIFLWADGKFIAPRPLFRDAKDERACEAILLGNVAELQAALARGVKVDATSRTGSSLLNYAAEAGIDEAVEVLLARGAKPDGAMLQGTPLSHAAPNGRLRVVRRLLAAKADPSRHRGAVTPLQATLYRGHEAIALALVEAGADPNAGADLPAPVVMATEAGFAEVLRAMLARGAKWQLSPEEAERTMFDQACLGHTAMCELLLEKKHPANSAATGATPLWAAVRTQNAPLLKLLLGAGVPAEQAGSGDLTPLMLAAVVGNLECSELLLASGANAKVRRRDGNTVLHFAATHNVPALTERLLGAGAERDARGVGGLLPLEIALVSGAGNTARVLARQGARCDLRAAHAEEALGAAVALDLGDVVQAAIADGWSADRRIQGHSPIWLARAVAAKESLAAMMAAKFAEPGAAEPEVVDAARLDETPHLVHEPLLNDLREPPYRCRAQHAELDIIVDDQGAVCAPRIRTVSTPSLAAVALHAVRDWRFSVPRRNGKPVATRLVHTVNWPAVAGVTVDRTAVDVAPIPITRWLGRVLPYSTTGDSGEVRAEFVVDTAGHAGGIRILSAPDADHARVVSRSLPEWSFTPGILNGEAVQTATVVTAPVTF